MENIKDNTVKNVFLKQLILYVGIIACSIMVLSETNDKIKWLILEIIIGMETANIIDKIIEIKTIQKVN